MEKREVVPKAFRSVLDLTVEERAKKIEVIKEYSAATTAQACVNFANMMKLWRDHDLWKDFASSWKEFCSDKIGKPAEWVHHVIRGVSILNGTPKSGDHAYKVSIAARDAELEAESRSRGGRNNPLGLGGWNETSVSDLVNDDNIHIDKIGPKDVCKAEKRRSPTGTSRDAALNKLRKYSKPCDRPSHVLDHKSVASLRDRVLKGDTLPQKERLSANKALEMAGLRAHKITVQWKDGSTPEQIAARIVAKVDPAMLDAVIEALRQRK